MPRFHRNVSLILSLCVLTLRASAQQWVSQPIAQPVGGFWSMGMFDTSQGIAAGNASVGNGLSGVVRRVTGNPTWQVVTPANFTPALAGSFSFWSGVSALKGTGTAYICGASSKIYITTDFGATWQEKTSGVTGTNTLFDVFFKNANEGLAVGNNGVAFYTNNGGNTWSPQTTGTTQGLYAVHSAGTLWYVSGANNTMLKFTPPSTWTSINVSTGVGTFPIIEGLQFLNDQIGFFSSYNSAGSQHVFRTTDGAATWTPFPAQPPLGTLPFYTSILFFDQQKGWVGNVFSGSQSALAYTSNGGAGWTGYTPSGSGLGTISKLDFNNEFLGWAAGGAAGGGPIPTGFILKWTGSPPAPDISTTQTTASFGVATCQAFKDTTVIIKNSGDAALTINAGGITFSSPEFSYVGPSLPLSIPAKQQTAVTIRWTPSQTFYGPILGNPTMFVSSNDPVNPIWTITLSGQRNWGQLVFNTSSINFGDVCFGSSIDLPLDVTVEGNMNPTLVGFSFVSGNNDVTLVAPSAGTVITGPTTITLRFTPGAQGNRTGSFKILHGNPACPRETFFNFTGAGKSNKLTLSTSDVDFGTICAGSTKELTITVTNSGTAEAAITHRFLTSGQDVFPNAYTSTFGPIPPSGSMQYTVRFFPLKNNVGSFVATYRLVVGPCADTLTLTLRGVAVQSDISVVPTQAIVLGPIGIGTSAQLPATFTNNGSTSVKVTAVRLNPPNPALTLSGIPSLPMMLNKNQSVSITVKYTATKLETIYSSLCLVWSEPCVDSLCVGVAAISEEVPAILTIDSLDFPVQRCPTGVRDSFVVRNTGTGNLSIRDASFEGLNASDFTLLQPSIPVIVAPGDSVRFHVEYNSSLEGAGSATLVLAHNDPMVGTITRIKLTGRREVNEFLIEGDTLYRACIRQTDVKTLTLRNTTSRTLQVMQLRLVQGISFTLQHAPLPVTVPPGGIFQVTVRFQPGSAGLHPDSLAVSSEPCGVTRFVRLVGDGNGAVLTFTPPMVDFGTVNIGTSAIRTVDITNSGAQAVTIAKLHLQPADPAVTLLITTPMVIAPGMTRQVTLEFRPSVFGTLASQLCAFITAPCPDTLCIPVTGTAQSDGLSFDRVLQFTLDPCQSIELCDTVRLVNNSASVLTVTNLSFNKPAPFRFGVAVSTPFQLASGQSRALVICAGPDFTGIETASLVVDNSSSTMPRLELPLTARRDSVGISADHSLADFGTLARCEIPRTLSFTLTNNGTSFEILTALRNPSGAFSLTESFPLTLLAGESKTLTVTFAPQSDGVYLDSLVVRSGRCNRRLTVLIRGEMQQGSTITPSPLVFGNVAVGSSQILNLSVENRLGTPARVTDISISPPGVFASWGAFPATIMSGQNVLLPVRFAPVNPGKVTATACIIFDLPCPDTVCVTLEGTGNDAELEFRPAPLRFETLAQCEDQTLSDTLLNQGSSDVTLTGSVITGSGAASFTLLDPVVGTEILAAGAMRIFKIRFDPAAETDGVVNATLSVTRQGSAAPVELFLEGRRVTQQTPPSVSLSFGAVTVGSPASRQVTLTNNGTSPFSYTSADLPSALSLSPPLPVTINPGQSIQFTVTLTPTATGIQSFRAVLRTTTPCNDSTILLMDADVRGTVTQSDVMFGVLPNCEVRRQRLVLYNTQGKPVDVVSMSISGPDTAFFRIAQPLNFPVSIAPMDSMEAVVELNPAPGVDRTYNGLCLSTLTVDGQTLTAQSSISAAGLSPTLTLLAPVNFGPVSLGIASAPLVAQLRNDRPFPIRISSVQSSAPEVAIVTTTPGLPASLDPGVTLRLTLTCSPSQEGSFTAVLTVVTDLPCQASRDIQVTAVGVDNFTYVDLSIPDLSGAPDDTILVPIMLNTNIGGTNVTSWSGGIQFNRSMLYPLRVVTANSLSSAMNVTFSYEQKTGTLAVDARNGPVFAGTGPLVFVEFLVLIGDNVTTPLTVVPGFNFTSGLARVRSTQNGRFGLKDYCLVNGNRLIRSTAISRLHQNSPNPFNATTRIEYEIGTDGEVELLVHDLLGRIVATLVKHYQTAGRYTIRFDAEDLPGGIYLYSLRVGDVQDTKAMHLSK